MTNNLSEIYLKLSEAKMAISGLRGIIPSDSSENDDFNRFLVFFLSKLEIDLENISLRLLSDKP